MKALIVIVVLAIASAAGLTWNRERKVEAAMIRAKAVYDFAEYHRGSTRVSMSLGGCTDFTAFDRETTKYMEELAAERRESERRAQMIGYFTSPPDL